MTSTPLPLVAILGVGLLLSRAPCARAQTATIDPDKPKQSIRGFGGINHPLWAGDLTAEQRTTAFGNGPDQLGMTVLRMFISDNKNDWSGEVDTAKRAIDLGAIAFASPWNPPSSMTEMVNGRKRLRLDQYGAYATHLNDFTTFMKDKGVELYAISIQNEPDYANDWTSWTEDEVYNFVVNNAGSLIADKVITAESFTYRKSYYDKILNDPKALANVDILGTHLYGTAVSNFPYPLFDQKGAGKERWMTEHYTDSANDADLWPMALDVAYEIHNSMVEAQFNAYVWWYIRRKYGPIKEDGHLSKRGYCFAQFSKFIRPGYVRVEATKNPTTDVYVSAYKHDSDLVIVLVNRSTSQKKIALSVLGTSSVSAYQRFTTSASKSLADDGAITASTGTFSVTLDAQSVSTLHGQDSSSGPGGSAGVGGSRSAGGGGVGGDGTAGSLSTGGVSGSAGASGSGIARGASGMSSRSRGGNGAAGTAGSAGSQAIHGSGGAAATGGQTGPADDAAAVNQPHSTRGCSCHVVGDASPRRPSRHLMLLSLLVLAVVARRSKVRARATASAL